MVENKPKERIVACLRVSSDSQDFKSQKGELEEKAEKLGIKIQEYYVEKIGGEKDPDTRIAFNRLVADGRAGKFDKVWFFKLDRIARTVLGGLLMLDDLKKADLPFDIVEDPQYSSSNPHSDMLRQMGLVIAEQEHKNIGDRIRAGHRARVRSGKYLGHTKLNKPFGYDIVDSVLVLNQKEIKVIICIYKSYTRKNMSTKQIADDLNDRGILSPTGKKWRPSSINKVLSKNYYSTGIFQIGKKLGKYELSVPTIVSKAMFKKAQEKKIARKVGSRRNAKHDYLLRGIIYCDKCGYQLFGGAYKRKHKEDQIFYRGVHSADITTKRCTPNCGVISERQIVRTLAKTFYDALFNAREDSLRQWLAHEEKDDGIDEETILKGELVKLDSKRSRIIENYEDSLIDKKVRDTKLIGINGEVNRYQAKLSGIQSQKMSKVDQEEVIEKIIHSVKRFKKTDLRSNNFGQNKKIELSDEVAYETTRHYIKDEPMFDRIEVDFKKKVLYIHIIGGTKVKRSLSSCDSIDLMIDIVNSYIKL